MGGNALKRNIEKNNVIRASLSEYNDIEKNMKKLLDKFSDDNLMDTIQAKSPRYIKDKKDFGDLDLVISSKSQIDTKKLLNFLKDNLKVVDFEYFKNSHVLSFSYPLNNKVFQVDLISVSLNNFESSLNYLSDNDFSNFLGRMFRKLGVKLTPLGLEYRYFLNNEEIKKEAFLLTKNWKEILEFLGLDYSIWEKGFNNSEEMFTFITKSKFFKKKLFPFANLNHSDRMRDKKRPNYNKFLKFLENKDVIDNFNGEFNENLKKEQGDFLLRKYNKLIKKEKLDKRYKEFLILKKYFNGNVLKELFNVENIELGNLIKEFKKYNKELLEEALIIDKLNMKFENKVILYKNFLKNLKRNKLF